MQGQRAGIVSRSLADAIDIGVVLVTLGAIYAGYTAARFLLHPRTFTWPQPTALALGALYWALMVIYLSIGWATSGRTVGKTMLGLRVVRRSGQRIGGVQALARSLLYVVFPLGLLWCAVDRRRASVQDLLVRSVVIYDWESRIPSAGG